MPRSNAPTSKKALARIQRLCCLGIGGEMLIPDLMRAVSELIGVRGGSFVWMASARTIGNSYYLDPFRNQELRDLYRREFHETPRISALMPTYSQLIATPGRNRVHQHLPNLRVDHRTFLRSDFYNAIYRPAGVYEPVTLVVPNVGRSHGFLFLYRGAADPRFTSGEINLLETIAGFVAHAMGRKTTKDETFGDRGDSDDCALFVAGLDGAIRQVSVQARRLLAMALTLSPSSAANQLNLRKPIAAIVWLCRALAAAANGEPGQPPPILRLQNPFGRFVLRAYWLEPIDGVEQTRYVGIMIERQVPRVLALHRKVEELPLTNREKQLCLLLALDRSRQDIADMMGVSAGTIITHQSNIYAKLDVHSRAELLAALLPG